MLVVVTVVAYTVVIVVTFVSFSSLSFVLFFVSPSLCSLYQYLGVVLVGFLLLLPEFVQ